MLHIYKEFKIKRRDHTFTHSYLLKEQESKKSNKETRH